MINDLDVLLIVSPTPNLSTYQALMKQNMPPLGMGYIATYLIKEKYTAKIIDMNLSNNTIDSVLTVVIEERPKVFGISCTTESYNTAIRIAEIIKGICPNGVIVLGGPHVTFEYESALNNKFIDFVILNEGEISFKKLCDYLIRNTITIDDLKGVAYKKDGTIVCTPGEPFIEDLDSLPFPNRELFDNLSLYNNPATISTSRGCPGKCVFCAASVLSGGRYRMRSAQSIVSEFKYLKSLGFNHVDVIDDTMTANRKRLNDFLNALLEENLQMTWYCESRVDSINRDILIKMKAAGLKNIQFGVESGSQEILNSINKGITLEQIFNAFKWCREIGIEASTNMIIGQPNDNMYTIEKTIDLAEKITSLGAWVSFSVCTPFPGTSLWERKKDFGIEIIDYNLDHYNTFIPVMNTRHLTATDIRNAFYKANKRIAMLRNSYVINKD